MEGSVFALDLSAGWLRRCCQVPDNQFTSADGQMVSRAVIELGAVTRGL